MARSTLKVKRWALIIIRVGKCKVTQGTLLLFKAQFDCLRIINVQKCPPNQLKHSRSVNIEGEKVGTNNYKSRKIQSHLTGWAIKIWKSAKLQNWRPRNINIWKVYIIRALKKLKSGSVNIEGGKVGTNHYKSRGMQSHSGHIVPVQGAVLLSSNH